MARLKTLDDTVQPSNILAAKGALKYIRTLKSHLDRSVDDCHKNPAVRHVAEECLRVAAKKPLPQVPESDRLKIVEKAIVICGELYDSAEDRRQDRPASS